MGYESRVYVVSRFELNHGVYAEKITQFDLCCVGTKNYERFFNAFNKEIDYQIVVDGAFTDTDCYGAHMKSATLPDLVDALKACEEAEHYRRFPPIIAMLEAFSAANESDWNGELEAVHYGY